MKTPKASWGFPVALMAAIASHAQAADAGRRAILYEGTATELGEGLSGQDALWVTTTELQKATGFELKPQGVCRGELCFPIPKPRKDEFLRTRSRTTWFNLGAFAKLVDQPVARDEALRVYCFGARADQRNAHVRSLQAPDFSLPDKDGRQRSLSEFRGKKVLLVTWASW
jgi:hypothetical protein